MGIKTKVSRYYRISSIDSSDTVRYHNNKSVWFGSFAFSSLCYFISGFLPPSSFLSYIPPLHGVCVNKSCLLVKAVKAAIYLIGPTIKGTVTDPCVSVQFDLPSFFWVSAQNLVFDLTTNQEARDGKEEE